MAPVPCGGLFSSVAAGLAVMLGVSQAALPTPLVNLRLNEASGEAAANTGSLAGSANFVQTDGFPLFTNAVPTGQFAPAGNSGSVDFGNITASGQGGRAIDLSPTAGDGSLGTLTAFTVCGWVNARNLAVGWGGNRIAFALAQPNGPGFDLVQLANGALRIGINQWPDGSGGGGPSSSSGKIKADPQTGATNWVFFAVAYDSSLESGNVKYYFGRPDQLAVLDGAHNYKGGVDNGGLIEISGMLTLGNFGEVVGARNETGPNGGSRVFRGLIDELRVYDQALDLAQVQQAQLNGATPGVAPSITRQPVAVKAFAGQPVTFNVEVTGTAPFTYQWQRNGVDIPGATSESYTLQAASADHDAAFRVKISNAVASNVLSEAVQLQVVPENGHKIFVSFSDGGVTTTNRGNLGGVGAFAQRDGFPAISANVPAGSFAPPDNIAAVDFGVIEGSQGGRAIDFDNSFDNTVGPMTAFTVTGWLNSRDLTEGWGGNRIAFALASPGGPGFDVVQLADGALRIGVNQWPDAGEGGPRSSPGMITADPAAPADNWVFFAVTYDSELPFGQVNYYFGKGNQAAQLDSSADYAQGPILRSGPFTIGNFSSVDNGARNGTGNGGGSRVFRGLIDELNVFNKALSLNEIVAVQKTAAYKPVTAVPANFTSQPQNVTAFQGNRVTFQAGVAGTPPVSIVWKKLSPSGIETDLPGATNQTLLLENAALADSGSQFWAVASNSAGSQTSQRATLTVLAETNQKIVLSFTEGSGTVSANQGNLGGSGAFTVRDNYPVFSTQIPAGAFAPTGNSGSVDFGMIEDGQGGRAIDYTNAFGNTLGSMDGFTLTGWLNSRDLRAGGGGNRILFALASPAGPGFDLVQNADGSLQLGVNQWPDGTPAISNPGRITEDAEAGAANWVFFAVTYDGTSSSGNVSYYFGSPDQAAELDMTADYDRGPILTSGPLTVGNFGSVVSARTATGPGGSRVFRGLMDELKVFNKVLTESEIRNAQKAAVAVAVTPPKLLVSRQGGELVLEWDSTAVFQLQSRAALGSGDWAMETVQPAANGSRKTIRLQPSENTKFYRLIKP